jgi:hypothetical protein
MESLAQLFRHERLDVAGRDDFAPRNSADLEQVIVCDPATSNDADPKHGFGSRGNRQRIALDLQPWKREASSSGLI